MGKYLRRTLLVVAGFALPAIVIITLDLSGVTFVLVTVAGILVIGAVTSRKRSGGPEGTTPTPRESRRRRLALFGPFAVLLITGPPALLLGASGHDTLGGLVVAAGAFGLWWALVSS